MYFPSRDLRRPARPATPHRPDADPRGPVCRRQHRFQAEVYAWLLPQPLPPIPVPLTEADPDIVLDLQTICTTVYDRAGYDYSLNYRHALEPSLSKADQAWAQQLLVRGARVDRYSILNEERRDTQIWRGAAVLYYRDQLARALDLMGVTVPARM